MYDRNKAVQCAQVHNKMCRAREQARLTAQEMLDNFHTLGAEEVADYTYAINKCVNDWKVWSQVFQAINPELKPLVHL